MTDLARPSIVPFAGKIPNPHPVPTQRNSEEEEDTSEFEGMPEK